MTKEHLIGRIARATLKGSFNNAEEHFKCAESLSQISIEYAISVLEEIRKGLPSEAWNNTDHYLQELKNQIV